MVYQKFIIETDDIIGDCLIIAKCTYHKQLATDISKVKGGGMWTKKDSTITLFGESHDFGKANIEDIQKCIDEDKVYWDKSLTKLVSNEISFKIDLYN